MTKRIDSIRFKQISREIKSAVQDGDYNTDQLAEHFDVSRSTITNIKRAKTWPGYLALKATRRSTPSIDPKEVELALGIEQLELNTVKYVTTKQFTDAVDSLTGKAKQAQKRADDAISSLDRQAKNFERIFAFMNKVVCRKPGWFRERS